MGKGIKYGLCVLAGAVVLAVATAAVPPPDGFRMGRNMEVLVNMLRDISLFYVDDVDPDELLSDAAAGMTAGLDPYTVFISEEDMDTFQLLTTGRYGGGVMPDVRVPAEDVSRFAYVVYGKGYIHDFVDGFMRRNRDREIVPGSFALSDADYADFTAFMQDKDVEWESDTKRLLARLKESAEAERYMDSIGVYLEGIEANLDDDVRAGLQLYRQELTELIENEIVLRSAYNAGVVEHNMAKDPDVREALAVLNDPERYREILASKDTDRK